MSQENVQLVRRLLEPFEAGDIAAFFRDEAGWAARLPAAEAFYAPDFEASFVRADVGRARYVGLDGLRAAWLDWLAPWVSYRTEIEDLIDAGEGRVVVLTHDYARPEGVGAEVSFEGAPVWTVRGAKVARIDFYWDRAAGLAAAGLDE
jgi:ketosteroid isomerase-like protein